MAHWGDIRSPNQNNSIDWLTSQIGSKQNQGLTDELANLARPPDPESENAVSTEIDNGANHLKAFTFEDYASHKNPLKSSYFISNCGGTHG